MKKEGIYMTEEEALAVHQAMAKADSKWLIIPFKSEKYERIDQIRNVAEGAVKRIVLGFLLVAGVEAKKAIGLSDRACSIVCDEVPEPLKRRFAFWRDPLVEEQWFDPLEDFLCGRGLRGCAMAGYAALGVLAGEDGEALAAERYRYLMNERVNKQMEEDFWQDLAFFCDCGDLEEETDDVRAELEGSLRGFIREWNACANGTTVDDTQYLRLLRDYANSEFGGELLSDKEYLENLPLLSYLLISGRESSFTGGDGILFYGLAGAEKFEVINQRAAELLTKRPECSKARALTWALDILVSCPAVPRSPALQNFPGWEVLGRTIRFQRIFMSVDNPCDEDCEGILITHGVEWHMAWLVAEALLTN